MIKRRAQYGFSLIELLVVSGVIVILTGFVVSNYNAFNRIERLRQAAKTLKTDLRSFQTKATAGVKPAAGCTTLRGYTVSFTATSYSVQPTCTNGVGTATAITLPTDISFNPVPSPFMFTVLSGTIPADVTLTLTSVSRNYRIQVSRSGDVNDLGLL